MAITVTQVSGPHSIGDRWQTVYTVQPDNSYPTGGYSLKNTDLGFSAATDDKFQVFVQDAQGYGTRYDYGNQKLLFYTSAGTQTTNATDLSGLSPLRVVAQGKYRA